MREIAPRRSDRREVGRSRSWSRRCLAGIGPLTQGFGEPLMSFLLLGSGELHREIEEAIGIPLRVALYETYELLR